MLSSSRNIVESNFIRGSNHANGVEESLTSDENRIGNNFILDVVGGPATNYRVEGHSTIVEDAQINRVVCNENQVVCNNNVIVTN